MTMRHVCKTEHPRIRGENPHAPLAPTIKFGTSPHTRGKRHLEGTTDQITGNIPAYAGKTRPLPRQPWVFPEHPRIRGENIDAALVESAIQGTSPHTRGKQCNTLTNAPNSRNIPAYAGKTLVDHQVFSFLSEHPRIRGENRMIEIDPVACQRNIPAYAGKTPGSHVERDCGREHPRIRGENQWPGGGE